MEEKEGREEDRLGGDREGFEGRSQSYATSRREVLFQVRPNLSLI